MSKENIFKEAYDAIVNLDESAAVEVAKRALREGVDPVELIEKGYTAGMKRVGEMFEREEIFIPHVMAAADALTAVINLLEPEIKRRGEGIQSKGKIVLGTIQGDIHDIGKNIVATMFRVYGYDVYDLGRDVPVNVYVEKCRESRADIVGASALMTTTQPLQKDLVDAVRAANLKTKVIVGGAPTSKEWADRIGADGHAENASEAVLLVKRLLS